MLSLTSASAIEEGQEVRIGGRWIVCEGTEHSHTDDGVVDRVTLWAEECPHTYEASAQLAVVIDASVTIDPRCTGAVEDGAVSHNGDTCPVHEEPPRALFVINYADAAALPGLYLDEAALDSPLLEDEDRQTRRDAAQIARQNPGEAVNLGDGDTLSYLTVQGGV